MKTSVIYTGNSNNEQQSDFKEKPLLLFSNMDFDSICCSQTHQTHALNWPTIEY